ncbi:MAG: ABC transporter permease [Alkaliphilus sp.]
MKEFFAKLIIFIMLLPLIPLMLWPFIASWRWPHIIPIFGDARGFEHFFSAGSNSVNILIFSIFLSILVTVITLAIAIPAAKAIAFYNFKGKNTIKTIILLPVIVPMVAVSMGIHVSFIYLGLANNCMGVVFIHIIPGLPYAVRILLNSFLLIGDDMAMQGKNLGANSLQVLWHITFPLIMPGVVAASTMVYIISFSQYFITFLIGGGRVVTFSMLMFPLIQRGERVLASTYSIIFLASILLVVIVADKVMKGFFNDSNFLV